MPAPTPLKGQDLDRSASSAAGVGPTGRAHAARDKVTCSAILLMGLASGLCIPIGQSLASLVGWQCSASLGVGSDPATAQSSSFFVVHSPQRYWSQMPDSAQVDYLSCCSSPIRHRDVVESGVPREGLGLLAGRQPRPARRVDPTPAGVGLPVAKPSRQLPGDRAR
jgi:hypothetical protein